MLGWFPAVIDGITAPRAVAWAGQVCTAAACPDVAVAEGAEDMPWLQALSATRRQ